MMLEYLEIGIVANTHGVKGELKVMPLTDDPARYNKLKKVFIEIKNIRTEYEILNIRFYKQFVLMTLKGIDDINKAMLLKGARVVIHRKDAVKLPEDTYFICDILGCGVYEGEKFLGEVYDVISTGSNDVYAVRDKEGKEILIPAIGHVINNIDVGDRRIDVTLPKGLVD